MSQVGVLQEIGFALGSGLGVAVMAALATAGFSTALLGTAVAVALVAGLIRFRT